MMMMTKKKIKYEQQPRRILAIAPWNGGMSIAWSSGHDPNIIHATKAGRKAKRANG